MFKKKHTFETNEIKALRDKERRLIAYFAIGVLLFSLVNQHLQLIVMTIATIWTLILKGATIESILAASAILLIVIAGMGLGYSLVYGIFVAPKLIALRKEREVKEWQATIKTKHDIRYFRETLSNVDGVTASILMDEKIQVPKDIVAQTVQLNRLGFIKFQDQKMHVIQKDASALSLSNRYLLTLIEKHNFSKQAISKWKVQAYKDAVETGYVIEEVKYKKPNFGCCLKFVIAFIIVYFSMKKMLTVDTYVLFEQYIVGAEETVNGFVKLIEGMQPVHQKGLFEAAIAGFGMVFGLYVFFLEPLQFAIMLFMNLDNSNFERTAKGLETTEKLLGLKAYIHDFGRLDEADKEAAVIWDDFLMYAIVLEENERIVEEISQYYGFDLSQFQVFGEVKEDVS